MELLLEALLCKTRSLRLGPCPFDSIFSVPSLSRRGEEDMEEEERISSSGVSGAAARSGKRLDGQMFLSPWSRRWRGGRWRWRWLPGGHLTRPRFKRRRGERWGRHTVSLSQVEDGWLGHFWTLSLGANCVWRISCVSVCWRRPKEKFANVQTISRVVLFAAFPALEPEVQMQF